MIIEMDEELPILKGILNGVVNYHNAPVRFGRVPKREKARILAAMAQSSNSRAHEHAAAAELDDEPRLLARVVRAHAETCEFTRDRVAQMRASARNAPTYSMPTLACPLNPAPELQSEKEFSQRFAHVIRGVIDFAGLIPGFQLLTQDDKFTLLKSGLFDALFVRLICMFDAPMDSIICLNGQLMGRDSIQNGANARFLVDSTFKFAERINSMNLTDAEVGLFCAIVLITPDRPGLRNVELVERMHARLKSCLQTVISQSRPDRPTFLRELMDTLPDLRTLSTLHTEKLVVFRTEHKELLRQKMWGEDETVESLHHGGWPADAAEDAAESPLGSVSSSESACSAEAMEMYGHAPLLAATLAGGCPARRRADSGGSHGSLGSHGSDEDALMHGLRGPHAPTSRPQPQRYRKLDSPTDSGIESGNEKHERLAGGSSSSCSSPRSSLEEHADERHHRHAVEDMPVLKRVLQAPPLYDTGSLMDEAYKPHKKFRAMRQRDAAEAEPARPATYHAPATAPAPTSQLQMHLSRPQHSSLSSTHSVLAKSLMEGPRMTPEQMKRTDIIHAYIRRGEAAHAAAVAAADDSACPLRGAGLLSCTTSATTTPSPTYRARWTPSAHPAYSPSGESRPYAQSPHSTSPAPYNAGPHVTHASLVELQVDIADTPQPLNLSKKSPSPPPATAPTPTSAPYLAPHKVLLEA